MHFGAQAYEILSDAEARARYDEIRAMGKERKYTGPQAFKTAFRTAEEVEYVTYVSLYVPYVSLYVPYVSLYSLQDRLSHCRGGFFLFFLSFPFFEESRTQVYRAPSLHDGFSHACACMCTRICTRVHTHVHTHATARCFILFYFVLFCSGLFPFRFLFS